MIIQRSIFGRTGLEIAVLGVGGHIYSDVPGVCDNRVELIDKLIQAGVNYFDTTWVNEVELLANTLKELGKLRDAHVSLQYVDCISIPRWQEHIHHEIERRLQIMEYDRAELFLMGVGNANPSLGEIIAGLEFMDGLKDEGVIKFTGLSCHTPEMFSTLAEAIEKTDLVDYMMIRYNWKYAQAAETLFPVCEKHNVGVAAMKPFCWDCGPGKWYYRISVFEALKETQKIDGLTPAQRSLLWSMSHPAVHTAVPAMNYLREAVENIQAAEQYGQAASTDDFDFFAGRLDDISEVQTILHAAPNEVLQQRATSIISRLTSHEGE